MACDRPASWWAAALRRARRRRPRGAGRAAGPARRRPHGARPGRGAAARPGPAGRAGSARSACGWPSPRRSSRPRPGGCSSGWARSRRPPRPCSPTPRSGPRSRRRWRRSRTPSTAAPTRRTSPRRCSRWSPRPGPAVGELPWLAELALPDADGGWAPAGELVLPGSPLAAVLDARRARHAGPRTWPRPPTPTRCAPSASSTRSRWCGPTTPTTSTWTTPTAGPTPCSTGCPRDAPPPAWPPLTAVRDLELVGDWHRALPLLAAAPGRRPGRRGRSAGSPCPGTCAGGCRRTAVLGGRAPGPAAAPGQHGVTGTVRTGHRRSARCWTCCAPPATVDDVLADVDGAIDLLDRLGDPARTVRARRAPDGLRPAWPRRSTGSTWTRRSGCGWPPDRVVEDAVVLDAPYLQPLVDEPVVPGRRRPGRGGRPARPAAGQREGRRARSAGGRTPAARGRSCPAPRWPPPGSGSPELAGEVAVHEQLTVDGRAVAWWPAADGSTTSTGPRPRSAGRWPGGPAPGRAAGAGRGVRVPRPRRRTGRRGRGRRNSRSGRPAYWPQRGMAVAPGAWPWVDGRPPACRPPGPPGTGRPVRRRPAGEQRQPVRAVSAAPAGWSAAGPPGAASGRRSCRAAGRGAGPQRCAPGEARTAPASRSKRRCSGSGSVARASAAGPSVGQDVTWGTSGEVARCRGMTGQGERDGGARTSTGADGGRRRPLRGRSAQRVRVRTEYRMPETVGERSSRCRPIYCSALPACRAWWASQRARSRARASLPRSHFSSRLRARASSRSSYVECRSQSRARTATTAPVTQQDGDERGQDRVEQHERPGRTRAATSGAPAAPSAIVTAPSIRPLRCGSPIPTVRGAVQQAAVSQCRCLLRRTSSATVTPLVRLNA